MVILLNFSSARWCTLSVFAKNHSWLDIPDYVPVNSFSVDLFLEQIKQHLLFFHKSKEYFVSTLKALHLQFITLNQSDSSPLCIL